MTRRKIRRPRRRPTARRNPAQLNPADRKTLASAMRLARQFHGTTAGHVVELGAKERTLPRFATVLGEIPELSYQPGRHSKRGGVVWQHAAGDRGPGQPRSPNRPVLAVDPRTRRPIVVPVRSPVRFNSRKGLVG